MASSVYKWLGLLCCCMAFTTHPLHVSVIQAEWNEKSNTLEISCKFFREDLEAAVAAQQHQKVDLEDPAYHEAMHKLVGAYIRQNLQLQVNGKAVAVEYLGYEIESESLYAYVQVTNLPAFQSVTFTNSLLYDQFTDQISIIHVKKGDIRHSVRLNYPDKTISVGFKN